MFRRRAGQLEVLLVHPGGPYFTSRDHGAWTIPKGEPKPGEELLDTARRECHEETGFAPVGPFVELSAVVQRGGKRVHAWAIETDWDPAALSSVTFTMEWPPRSGISEEVPEVDKAEWCSLDLARQRMNPAQVRWLDEIQALTDPVASISAGRPDSPNAP